MRLIIATLAHYNEIAFIVECIIGSTSPTLTRSGKRRFIFDISIRPLRSCVYFKTIQRLCNAEPATDLFAFNEHRDRFTMCRAAEQVQWLMPPSLVEEEQCRTGITTRTDVQPP
ncbi:hypothetical protein EVAR_97402_1 [Eumeta japonica]|uniref:Uncharacterized protein n=1 Tax=Eumeta variegata TaxID=151549 RepID=A0A4C1S9N4_EUMVA|nr:hypothetical protein EVAR_97402_1 [Eumeta japonica]